MILFTLKCHIRLTNVFGAFRSFGKIFILFDKRCLKQITHT